jgi:tRNA (guanine-N7-)-methyltransferase
MSAKNKLRKFAQLSDMPFVFENKNAAVPSLSNYEGLIVDMKGRWKKTHFKNDQPLVLELACGRGEYAVGLGRMFQERSFIGVDIKGARMWQGASIAAEEGLDNVAFLRTRIEQIALFFGAAEVDELWITFPDPFLREGKSNRRLTSAPFLERYRQFLKSGGLIHLKTDDPTLYDFTLETIKEVGAHLHYADDDIYARDLPLAELGLKTYYEGRDIAGSKKIKYIRFSL